MAPVQQFDVPCARARSSSIWSWWCCLDECRVAACVCARRRRRCTSHDVDGRRRSSVSRVVLSFVCCTGTQLLSGAGERVFAHAQPPGGRVERASSMGGLPLRGRCVGDMFCGGTAVFALVVALVVGGW